MKNPIVYTKEFQTGVTVGEIVCAMRLGKEIDEYKCSQDLVTCLIPFIKAASYVLTVHSCENKEYVISLYPEE